MILFLCKDKAFDDYGKFCYIFIFITDLGIKQWLYAAVYIGYFYYDP